MEYLSFPEALTGNLFIRLLAAAVLGGLIGIERDIHGRAAGLRTNLLVGLGAAVFMILSIAIAEHSTAAILDAGPGVVRADPSRIAAQIITGIGFLGAGTIIKLGISVRGLTTAASMWIVAGIGMAAGAGYLVLALFVAALALLSLVVLNRLERLYAKDSYRVLEVRTLLETDLSAISGLLERNNLKILHLDFERNYAQKWMNIRFTIRLFTREVTDKLSHKIIDDLESSGLPIHQIRWFHQ